MCGSAKVCTFCGLYLWSHVITTGNCKTCETGNALNCAPPPKKNLSVWRAMQWLVMCTYDNVTTLFRVDSHCLGHFLLERCESHLSDDIVGSAHVQQLWCPSTVPLTSTWCGVTREEVANSHCVLRSTLQCLTFYSNTLRTKRWRCSGDDSGG